MKPTSYVECTTCQARFSISDEALFGQIIACPQCGSMMNIPYPETETATGEAETVPGSTPENTTETAPAAVSESGISESGISESSISETSSNEPPTVAGTVGEMLDVPPVFQAVPPVYSEEGTLPDPVAETVPPVLEPEILPEPPQIPETIPGSPSDSLPEEEEPDSPTRLWHGAVPRLLSGIMIALLLAVVITMIRSGNGKNAPSVAKTGNEEQVVLAPESTPPLPDETTEPVTTEPVTTESASTEPISTEEVTTEEVPPNTPADTPLDTDTPLNTPLDTIETGSEVPPEETGGTPPTEPESTITEPPVESTAGESNESEPENTEPVRANESDKTGKTEGEEEPDETLDADFLTGARTTELPAQEALPTLTRERPKVDVDKGLATELSSIVFRGKKVAAALQLLSTLGKVPIVVDLDALPLIRKSLETPLDLQMEKITVGDVLTKMAELLHVTIERREDRVLLTASPAERNEYQEKTWDLSGLITAENQTGENLTGEHQNGVELPERVLSNPITTGQLTAMMTELVQPGSWEKSGGKGTLKIEGTTLTVRQTPIIQRQIDLFLEQLRGLRKLAPNTNFTPEELIPEVLGWEHLAEEVSLQFVEPVPLSTILDFIAKLGSLEILVDQAALADAGIRLETPAIVRVRSGSLAHTLDTLLEPLGLSYIILSGKMIEITSKEAASQHKTVEIHLFAIPGTETNSTSPMELVQTLQQQIEPETWMKSSSEKEPSDASPLLASSNSNRGCIWCDPVSGCLIVRQNPEIQRAVSAWLKLPGASSAGNNNEDETSKTDTPETSEEETQNVNSDSSSGPGEPESTNEAAPVLNETNQEEPSQQE